MRNEEGLRKSINQPLSAGTGINCDLQHLLDAAEQALLRFVGEPIGARSRMDAGLKQDLVGINVADARRPPLDPSEATSHRACDQ